MDNMFLVQYEPITTMTRRILSLGFEPKPTQEMIEKFYDEVNASDFYHNSIVLVVKAKIWMKLENRLLVLLIFYMGSNREYIVGGEKL